MFRFLSDEARDGVGAQVGLGGQGLGGVAEDVVIKRRQLHLHHRHCARVKFNGDDVGELNFTHLRDRRHLTACQRQLVGGRENRRVLLRALFL